MIVYGILYYKNGVRIVAGDSIYNYFNIIFSISKHLCIRHTRARSYIKISTNLQTALAPDRASSSVRLLKGQRPQFVTCANHKPCKGQR